MLIAISQRNDKNKYGIFVDSLESNYVEYLERFGASVIPIPNSPRNLKSYFEEIPIQGLVLSGGNDIGDSELRDNLERKMLEFAIEKKLPVLGICRGMQFINDYFGGKLEKVQKHVRVDHKVEFSDDKIKEFFGETFKTNSYHNYGINDSGLSPEFRVFARASDGVIEGLYHPKYCIAGIQWHPERDSPDKKINAKIINAFLDRELYWKPK